ncbi:MAG: acetyltransferase, family [Bacteroidota bacterium]|nr:acetyltransferase, family [Bacteroidota bacterium]
MARAFKIITGRLVIRCYDPATDAAILKKSIDESLEHLKPWMPWAWHEPELLEAKAERVKKFKDKFYSGEDYMFGVFNLDETVLLGSSGLHTRREESAREIGYWVHKDYINKGIATEIVCALTKVAFDIELLNRLEIRCDTNNTASAKVSEKCGYVLKEILKGAMKDVHGEDRDTMVWEVTKENYTQSAIRNFMLSAFDKTGVEIKP